jgi:hypothetical protein
MQERDIGMNSKKLDKLLLFMPVKLSESQSEMQKNGKNKTHNGCLFVLLDQNQPGKMINDVMNEIIAQTMIMFFFF